MPRNVMLPIASLLICLAAAQSVPEPLCAAPAGGCSAVVAQRDSLATAVLLLSHDIEWLEADLARQVAVDSLRLAQTDARWQWLVDQERQRIKRAAFVAGGTAALCVLVFWIAAGI